MTFYRRILVAIDGSPDAQAALGHAADLCRDQNARLTLLSVAPGAVAAPTIPVPQQDLRQLHVEIIHEAVNRLPKEVGVETRLLSGNPAATILRVAEEGNHDLIVMGSHGHSRFHRALLGSVSQGVLRRSTVPVLLVRACMDSPSGEGPKASGAKSTSTSAS